MTRAFNLFFSFNGETINSIHESNFDHFYTSLGNWRNIPVAIGGISPANKHVEHFLNDNWSVQPDFPFVSTSIYSYSVASLDGNLYIFGGLGGPSALAARYDGTGWMSVGSLLEARYGHRSLVLEKTIIHIGGEKYKLVLPNSLQM